MSDVSLLEFHRCRRDSLRWSGTPFLAKAVAFGPAVSTAWPVETMKQKAVDNYLPLDAALRRDPAREIRCGGRRVMTLKVNFL